MGKRFYDPQEVYELRPPEGFFQREFKRYAEGQWLADDGEWDLAFIGMANATEAGTGYSFAFPCCLYYDPPYHENILWCWLTTPWRAAYPAHKGGNPWHYSLRPGTKEWGESKGHARHPNRVAGDKGMNEISKEHGCANGRHAEFQIGNFIIKAGLLRRQWDKAVVAFPEHPNCMFCGLGWESDKGRP